MNAQGRCIVDSAESVSRLKMWISADKENLRKFWTAQYPLYQAGPKDVSDALNKAHDMMGSPKAIEDFLNVVEENGSVLKWYTTCEDFVLVGTQIRKGCLVWIPTACVTCEKYVDYSQLTGDARRSMLSGGYDHESSVSALVSPESVSLAEAKQEDANLHKSLEDLQNEMENVKEGKDAALADLQKEFERAQAALEAKKSQMLAELEARKHELNRQVRDMKVQIFQLESEIYAIRCYTGEVVEFQKIRDGLPAPKDTQLIVLQKLRYLDEELGKMASIFNADFSDVKYFNRLLQARDDVVETLMPYSRCMVLIKVSEKGLRFVSAEYNMLDAYQMIHGNVVGILIRDGERVYSAWTDEDKIDFSGEAFYRPGTSIEAETSGSALEQKYYESDEKFEQRIFDLRMEEAKSAVGRYFVFSVLQGLVDRKVIQFDADHVDVANSSKIVFSYADGMIVSNEYGTFDELWDKVNSEVALGDYVLTVQRLRPSTYFTHKYETWYNDRGIGDRNRTHDVSCGDNEVYPINFVRHYADYVVRTTYNNEEPPSEETKRLSDEDVKKLETQSWIGYSWSREILNKVEGSDRYRHYISLEKAENWETGKSARANFELYDGEFINLTYMNSVWLSYVIQGQKTGRIRIGGEYVDFVYLLRYLKTALDHVRKREENIVGPWLDEVDPAVRQDPKWPTKFSEWMLKNKIHNFSKFRCKQFVRYLKDADNSL